MPLARLAPLAKMSASSRAPLTSQIMANFPGPTHDSQLKTRELLDRDGRDHNIFMSNNIFHNHLAHHVLTAYSLGASPSLLEKIYQVESEDLAPLDPVERKKVLEKIGKEVRVDVPEVTEDNWTEFVGIQDAYTSYLAFFSEQIKQTSVERTMDRFLFSQAANAGGERNKNGPRMLIRFVAGVLHPIIHTGFGAEFSDPLVIAEGLAETAVHQADTIGPLFPSNWPYPSGEEASVLPGLSQNTTPTFNAAPSSLTTSEAAPSPHGSKTALEIYALFQSSSEITLKPYDPDAMINARLREAIEGQNGPELRKLVGMWRLEGKRDDEVVNELLVLGALAAGATGRLGRETRIDFFMMHILTSSLFVPSLLPLLPSTAHKHTLLQTYLLVALHTSLSRGRPKIDPRIPMAHTPFPSRQNKDREGNSWNDIVGDALFAFDSHTIKSCRSLLYGASRLGSAPPGGIPGSTDAAGSETIAGMAKLDGTLFIRVAGQLMDYMGWDKGEENEWDRTALGWDEAWEESKEEKEKREKEEDSHHAA